MIQTWQDRLRSKLLPLYTRLGPDARNKARQVFSIVQGTTFSRKARWIRDEYGALGDTQRRQLMLEIARFANINRPINGYYMEFGCHGANTIRMAYDSFRYLFDWHYVAFDFFEGLPEITAIDQQKIWEKGKLKIDEQAFIRICVKHGIPRNRLMTVKGFIRSVSLPESCSKKWPRKRLRSSTLIATCTPRPFPC